jgi:hypothetical protein
VVRATLVGLVAAQDALPVAVACVARPAILGKTCWCAISLAWTRAAAELLWPTGSKRVPSWCFARRNVQAARADLTRICAEIREELEPQEQALETAHALLASALESAPHPGGGSPEPCM